MNKKNNRLNILYLFALIGIVTLLYSYKLENPEKISLKHWRELGRVKAGFNGDHDRIVIDGPLDSYRRLKFRVENAPLNMHKLVVIYENGMPENIEVKNDIPEGGESRSINLHGGKRRLKTVEFWFDTKGLFNGKAQVILYGSK